MNVLLFHPDSEKARILGFALESHRSVELRRAPALEQAMGHLLEESPVDLIVMAENEFAPLMFKYLISVNSKIPVVLIKAEKNALISPAGINLVAQLDESGALSGLAALLDKFQPKTPMDAESGFCRIAVELLLRLGPLDGDVYVRLSGLKFVKLFNAGAVFSAKDLERVWGVKKIEHLYIARADLRSFMTKLQTELTRLTAVSSEGDETVFTTLSQVQDTIHGLAEKVGMTPEVIELTRAHVDLALKVIGQNPRLRKAVFVPLSKRESYIASHSVQLAFVACCISSRLDWPSNLTFQKLIFAAFMHDIALADPALAKIQTRQQLAAKRTTLTPDEVTAVESHMFVAGDLVNRFPQIPSDVYQIIVQHHERPDGSGFPRGMSGSLIAPLAAVFITAHEIVERFDEFGTDLEIEQFWAERVARYTTGTFKKILKVFSSSDRSA